MFPSIFPKILSQKLKNRHSEGKKEINLINNGLESKRFYGSQAILRCRLDYCSEGGFLTDDLTSRSP